MAPTFKLVAGAPKADLFVVPVFAGAQLGPGAELVDDALGGTLAEFMQETDFDGKRGEVLAVPTGGRLGARAALLLGVGDEDDVRRGRAAARRRGARPARVAGRDGRDHAARRGRTRRRPRRSPRRRSPRASASAATSSCATSRRPRRRSSSASLVIGAREREGARRARPRRADRGGGRVGARPRSTSPRRRSRPPTSPTCAQGRRARVGPEGEGVRGRATRARAHGRRARRRATAPTGRRGSCGSSTRRRGPRGTLAFVGKGVVFDSGGLSLKTAGGMETMKTDMSGAAAVIAAMSTLRDLGVKARVIGYVPLVENMPSGTAMRPGDVLTMRNGKTVEVLNTDAEGRLILADALSLASEEGADAIIDLATLTGAVTMALGDKIAGLMGSDDGGSTQVQRRGRPGRRAGVAPAAARRLPPQPRLRDRRPAQHLVGRRRGHADRGALPEGVHRRRAVGAPRHRGNGARRRPTTRRPRRAAPATACARSSSSRRRSASRASDARGRGRRARRVRARRRWPRAVRRSRRSRPSPPPVDLRGQDSSRDRRQAEPVHARRGHRRRRHEGHVDEHRHGRAQRQEVGRRASTSARRSAPTRATSARASRTRSRSRRRARSSTRARSTR